MSSPAPDTYFRFHERAVPLNVVKDVSTSDSALVVIDAQNFYLPDGDFPVAGITKTNKVINELVQKYRKVGCFVFLLRLCLLTSCWQVGGTIVWVAHTYDNTKTAAEIKGSPLDINEGLGFSHDKQSDNELFMSKAYGSR